MVHLRLNAAESNPNPFINFISALHTDETEQERARTILKSLAAQVKPIMKRHGFTINSLEEYEFNTVFAGRNWNNGEVIELVLRRPNGSFYGASHLLNVLCHELAHITHMNHLPPFQALWRKLRSEVDALQVDGYFGDGFWSGGKALQSAREVAGSGITCEDHIPENMCGGAQKRTRTRGRRRRNANTGLLAQAGTQIERRRKPRRRVTGAGKFNGEGHAVNEDIQGEEERKIGTGFRKKANSKRAREERANAAENRSKTIQARTKDESLLKDLLLNASDTESEDDDPDLPHMSRGETDSDRLKMLRDCMASGELDLTKGYQPVVGNIDDDEPARSSKVAGKRKVSALDDEPASVSNSADRKKVKPSSPLTPPSTKATTARTAIVRHEGLPNRATHAGQESTGGLLGDDGDATMPSAWSCCACTFDNPKLYLACAACGTERAAGQWVSGDLNG